MIFGGRDSLGTDDIDSGYDAWNDLHTATLEDCGLSEKDSNCNWLLYHPDSWRYLQ